MAIYRSIYMENDFIRYGMRRFGFVLSVKRIKMKLEP